MKIKQTSLDQTGVAIIEINNSEKIVPLFSLHYTREAEDIAEDIRKVSYGGAFVKSVFLANNLLDYRIEDAIADFQSVKPKVLPEDMMDELLSGFPFITGNKPCFYPMLFL